MPGLTLLSIGALCLASFWGDQLSARGWASLFLYGIWSIPVYVLTIRAASGSEKWLGFTCLVLGILLLSRVPALQARGFILGVSTPRWLAVASGLLVISWLTVSALDKRGYVKRWSSSD
jgi:hypothetical protein